MQFFFHPLTAAEAEAMLQWRYTGEFAIYNMADEPDENDVAFLVDPQNGYYGVTAGEMAVFNKNASEGEKTYQDRLSSCKDLQVAGHNRSLQDDKPTYQEGQQPAFSGNELIGFCCFGEDGQVPGGDYTAPALDIGLGLRPDRTGLGLGTGLLAAILDFAQQHYAPESLRATIASFNLRSQRVFAKNGFYEVARFISGHAQPREFVVVWRDASPPGPLA